MPDSSLPNSQNPKTIWEALNTWAGSLKPWQRRIIAHSMRRDSLSEGQVDEVYQLFLEEHGLTDRQQHPEIAIDVSGRPTKALAKSLWLTRIENMIGVNALPDGSSLSFGPGLTVIYGRNGAGKSGFARLLANACFSRHKPDIVGNIYAEEPASIASARISISIDDQSQEFQFTPGDEQADLRRFAFFDTAVAKHHISQITPFEFKPAGFDVFPEMARVYGILSTRLAADIAARTHNTTLSDSFIGVETSVSRAVASINATTNLDQLRAIAAYDASEKARLEEIDQQLLALRSNTSKELLAQLRQAHSDISELIAKLIQLGAMFTPEMAAMRTKLAADAKQMADAAAMLGTEQFKRSFFKAVGTSEWQTFAKAAHALARMEEGTYPGPESRCLLCERPFDNESRKHVDALMSFVESDMQRNAASAQSALEDELRALQALNFDIFFEGTRVRDHVHRLDPSVESIIVETVNSLSLYRDRVVVSLQSRIAVENAANFKATIDALDGLTQRIEADIARLAAEDPTQAIDSLELEHQTLRRREVLSQLLPRIEKQVMDAKWCLRAENAKTDLNPRPITEKEKELFSTVVGASYRMRLAEECGKLDCSLPIELQTAGQRGKTVRSLEMKGGYKPGTILSEGEQKAVALADFLTEVALNPANAGIVLDDPVTSQDHQRKDRIAERLVEEAKRRQVIVFTHDLPFLNQIIERAETTDIDLQTHWVDRDSDGNPGHVTLHDAPATSKAYDTAERAKKYLVEAKATTGSVRVDAIMKGMGALRRTIEETVVKKLFKGVVPRWQDRVIVTALRNVSWDHTLVDELVDMYEELSGYIEGHSHTDEAMGAPPQVNDLEARIDRLEALIKRARAARSSPKSAAALRQG